MLGHNRIEMAAVFEGVAIGAATGAMLLGIDTARGISNCASGYVWEQPLGATAATIVHGVPIASPAKEIATKTAAGGGIGAIGGFLGGIAEVTHQ